MRGRERAGARLQTVTTLLAVLSLTAPDAIQEVKTPHVAGKVFLGLKLMPMTQQDLRIAKSRHQPP